METSYEPIINDDDDDTFRDTSITSQPHPPRRGPRRMPPRQTDSLNSSTLSLLTPPNASYRFNRGSVASVSSRASDDSRTAIPRSISDKFSLSVNPSQWNLEYGANIAGEADDFLHNPDGRRDKTIDQSGSVLSPRGIANIGFLIFLALALTSVFAGYPIFSYFQTHKPSNLGGHNIGGVNGSGQVPTMPGGFGLIDPDTPKSAYYYNTHKDNSKWQLVFSDEFNVDGRSFYPGDDPYWEAVDLHYWATSDLEWYDPSAVTTREGSLVIVLSQEPIHDLNYKGGHISSWNKFCFTGGYVEVNVSLPGDPKYAGLWPAIWTMGNLGRAGYGATTDGMWPYGYDSCDWGTLPNQTFGDQPPAAFTDGDKYHDHRLSFQSGQRLSRCTCPNDPNHPGPKHSDGTFYGRMAPELDIFEASSFEGLGSVSQSGQYAPYNVAYNWSQGPNDVTIYNTTGTILNAYKGGVYQQAVSAVSTTNQNAYETTGGFTTYGIEYKTGPDGYVTWFSDGKPTWTMNPSAIGADSVVNISQRIISPEPMYVIMNLGISPGFGKISPNLYFPTAMMIDYVRIYQDPNDRQVGCSPANYPTADYIKNNLDIYTNPNYTSFALNNYGSFNGTKPKNKLTDTCG